MDSNGAILFFCAILFLSYFKSLSVHALDLSVYQTAQFTNPVTSSEFTKFTRHNETGTIYIGASNALYQLGPDFVKMHMVDTRVEECESSDVVSCPNFNKILVIDYVNNTIITCGSENYVETDMRGTCNLRDVNDISIIVLQNDEQVVPPDLLTTEAIIGPGPDGWYLYVGETFDGEGNHPFIISRRVLSGQENNILRLDKFTSIHATSANYASLTINFVGSFLYKGFTYFVTHQRQEEPQEEPPEFISKISRVCQGDEDNLNSFTEITLECVGQNGIVYNLIQAAHVGLAGLDLAASIGIDELNVLYGIFAKSEEGKPSVPSMQSVLCIFRMDDIEGAMFEAVAGCFGRNPGGTNPEEVAQQYRVNYLAGGNSIDSCRGLDITDEQVRGQLCSPSNWRYAKGILPLKSSAVIEWTDITPSSIIITTHKNHTIAFVGTVQGDMVKVHIEDKDAAREYERFSVGSPVLRDTEIDEDQEQLNILTKLQLLRLNLSRCEVHTTCSECIGSNGGQDGDPYCGWCTLNRRCSRHDSCPMDDVSTRWLPYNSAQCVDISMVAPYDSLPITLTEQQITLTVEELPDLASINSYQCIFNYLPPVSTAKNGNQLSCITPTGTDIPTIPAGRDHVTVQLYIFSTETQVKFVQRSFNFYECSSHKGCMSCTNSNWACDWCIYSNKCTHDNATCTEDSRDSIVGGVNNPEMKQRHGSAECPQLIALDREILIPVGVSRDIRVTGTNLPDDSRVSRYTCVLSIEGIDISTAAERNGDELTCISRMYFYSAAIQEVIATVSVVWNNDRKLDDLHGLHVTFYKCEVQRPDCSRCLSKTTARQELMCGWCTADDMCTDISQCSGDWITLTGNQNCPVPVLFSVWPPSGPNEGNTIISVTGTDLGTQFTDIVEITVGGKLCRTDGLSQEYLTGQSVSCRTMSRDIDSEVTIIVTIQGNDGNVQQSTGNVVFTYRDPYITSFEPTEGPEAGGTMVTIRGQYLDACSHISASIGSAECRINRMTDVINATTAVCYTTDAPIGTSERLQVFFDGAMRQSADMFTYRPNPTVTNVHPLNTIQSGGISLTVTGSDFDLAQGAQMVMYIQSSTFQENCDVHNNTMMVCRTPDTRPGPVDITRRRRQADPSSEASFGFIIADVTDLLMWSEKNDITLTNFPDPMYSAFPDPIEFSNIINIKGEHLNAGSTQDDVTVYIGEEPAAINSLGASVLTITIPDQNPGRECVNGNITNHPCIFVFHGNLEFNIGTVRYPKKAVNTLAIILGVGISIVVFLAILVAVAIAYFVFQNRKLKKERDALILERLILLQKSVDETIDSLSRESNSKNAGKDKSIFLPNNVKINPEDVKIRFNELTLGRSLGHGAFGEVFLADLQESEGNCIQVAVKSIQGKKDPSTIIKFLEEGLIMKDFDHPNVLGLIGLTFDPDGNPLVIIPLMKNGDLKSFLKKTTMEIATEQHLRFAIDAAKGMAYLAGKKFIHRDLAARNCMVDEDLVVKIGDFGRSREMEDDYEYISQDRKAKLPVKWMAPESIGYKRYNEKTDVWSFGVLLWEIFTNGTKPYRSIANRDMYDYICKGNRLPHPEGCRKDVYDIMLLCWNMNPKDRCTFQDLTKRLTKILNLPTREIEENQNEMALDIDMGRDSYLHPMEEKETVGEEEEEGTEGDDYVNVNNSKQRAIVDNDGYTHLVGQHNATVDLEMTSLN